MSEKKISRRDAIKLLGAVAGASVLANLPSKWSTPELATGFIPAHAQTSCGSLTITTVQVAQSLFFVPLSPPFGGCGRQFTLFVQISAAQSKPLQLQTSVTGSVVWYQYGTDTVVAAPDGTYNTDNNGSAGIGIKVWYNNQVTFEVSFLNASDGCDTKSTQIGCA